MRRQPIFVRDIHSLQRCTTSPEPKRHSIEQNLSLDSACCKTRMGIKWTVATPFFMCTELHTLPTKGCTRHLQHLCSQPCSDGDRSTYGTPEMPSTKSLFSGYPQTCSFPAVFHYIRSLWSFLKSGSCRKVSQQLDAVAKVMLPAKQATS